MFPVVMLVINIRALRSLLFICFASPVLLSILPVIYMLTVAVRASLLIAPGGVHIHRDFTRTIDIAQVTNMVLSLLTNIFATSIIALKAWCVRIDVLGTFLLTAPLSTTRSFIKAISRVADDK